MNLLKKEDRVCLFQYVLYGNLTDNQHVKLPINKDVRSS